MKSSKSKVSVSNDSVKLENKKLYKKLLDTEKEINKRKMLSSCFYKDYYDTNSVLLSGSNRSSKQSGSSGEYLFCGDMNIFQLSLSKFV